MTTRARLLALACFSVAILPLGCGGGNPNLAASVSGTVTYKGTPVTGGRITFYATTGEGRFDSDIGTDGGYNITGMPAGEMTVTVETESINPNKKMPTYGQGAAGAPPKGGGMSPAPEGAKLGGGVYMQIPQKYAGVGSTDLKTTLTRGKNTYKVPLTD